MCKGLDKMKIIRIFKLVKRVIVTFVCLVIIAVLLLTGVNIYVKKSVKDRILSVEEACNLEDVDCIIILGASVTNGDTPSGMLADRLNRGIELYFEGCSPKIIMSGDHGSIYYDEVNVMKNYAMERNVPSEDIFMDHAGFSTYESMYRAKEVFGAKKVVIVTQEYHLPRALYIAEQFSVEAYGVASEGNNYNGQSFRDVREFLAIGKDFITAWIKPKPTILGGTISLNGNGNVTNDKDF